MATPSGEKPEHNTDLHLEFPDTPQGKVSFEKTRTDGSGLAVHKGAGSRPEHK